MNTESLLKALFVFILVIFMSWIGSLLLPESGLYSVLAIATVGAVLTFLIDRKQTNHNDADKKD
ncbi:MAG: hypothetical protein HFE78_01970 [Clostridiales bacterium]|nr:hypothetical protein [Clostridiales bacterium]